MLCFPYSPSELYGATVAPRPILGFAKSVKIHSAPFVVPILVRWYGNCCHKLLRTLFLADYAHLGFLIGELLYVTIHKRISS